MTGPIVLFAPQSVDTSSLLAEVRKQGIRVYLEHNSEEVLTRTRADSIETVLIIIQGESSLESKKLRGQILAERANTRVLLVHDLYAGQKRGKGPRWRFTDLKMSDQELLRQIGLGSKFKASKQNQLETDSLAVQSLIQTIDLLVGLHEVGDSFFASSAHRTMRLAADVAKQLNLPEEERQAIRLAALLRDLGKFGIDQGVFDESGELDEVQREEMQKHVEATLRLLAHVEFPWKVKPIIRHHHERYDGQGYPDRLKGPEIPVGARILSAVEAFIAITSERAYRNAASAQVAISELTREAGSQFDPEIIEALLRSLQERELSLDIETQPRVLIVDRDREFVRCLKLRLTNHGMKVKTIRLPPKLNKLGLTRFFTSRVKKYEPHVLVFAIDPEESEGLSARRRLQESAIGKDVPLVLLAPNEDRMLRIRALREGVDAYLTKEEDLESLVSNIENVLVRERLRRGDVSDRTRGIHGSLLDLSVADIVQMQTIGLKTARVEFIRNSEHGSLWFQEGRAVHASVPGCSEGEDSFFELLDWNDGSFRIEHGQASPSITIDKDPTFLLMEGLRRLDEQRMGINDASDEAAAG